MLSDMLDVPAMTGLAEKTNDLKLSSPSLEVPIFPPVSRGIKEVNGIVTGTNCGREISFELNLSDFVTAHILHHGRRIYFCKSLKTVKETPTYN